MRGDLSEAALIWTGKSMLEGRVALPHEPVAVVVFASAPALADPERDAAIVEALFHARIAVVYTPLLTDDELQFDARTAHFRFDAEMLAQRFVDIVQWAGQNRALAGLPVGCIGSSGAAAGAILAAAQRPDLIAAVVSIDGRTDLAADSIRNDVVPTLLVVRDLPVLRMNREAVTRLRGPRRIEIVHGAVTAVVEKTVSWMEERLGAVVAA